jgi:hypothetical protein
MDFGKLRTVPVKDVWQGEATHFTPWLAQNLAVLSEKLGMDLELGTVEGPAGDFSADIVARDLSTSRTVVIENQFGVTDHRHLGQIITYSSVLSAGVVVWIAETIRPEHKSAIDFLNQNLKEGLQLYALEVSVIRIDDSKPAYVFNTVCMPTETVLAGKDTGKGASETAEKYRAFFQVLIDELRTVHRFTNARAGQPQSWYMFPSENSKIYKYSVSFAQGGRVRVEVYIDAEDKAKNEALFDLLYSQKDDVEAQFNGTLSWEKLETKRACRIAAYRDGSIDQESEVLADIRGWSIENLLKMKAIFPKRFVRALETSDATI